MFSVAKLQLLAVPFSALALISGDVPKAILKENLYVQLRPALSAMEGAALIASSSADATVRLWRSKCWSCLRIFTLTPTQAPSPSLPFLSTALSPE